MIVHPAPAFAPAKTESITRQYRYPAGGTEITLAAVFEGDIRTGTVVRVTVDAGNMQFEVKFGPDNREYHKALGEFNKQVELRT